MIGLGNVVTIDFPRKGLPKEFRVPEVRLADVAKAANVSVATASRALNGKETVAPELAAKVKEHAARLGYRPNAIARNLRTRNTRMWALIISDITNPFFTSLARGVEDIARELGYSVFIGNTDEDPEREAEYVTVAVQEQVAGVIISPNAEGDAVSAIRDADIPIVIVDRRISADVDTVLVNSRTGARVATEHLLAMGWTHPVCISGPERADTAIERAEGYREAMGAAGLADRAIVVHAPYRADGGREAVRRLLDSGREADSFFTANAALALGALAELRERGRRVGEEVGFVSFDDEPWASLIDPPLSVVAQPAHEMGVQAARMLAERLNGTALRSARQVALSTDLIVRQSSRTR